MKSIQTNRELSRIGIPKVKIALKLKPFILWAFWVWRTERKKLIQKVWKKRCPLQNISHWFKLVLVEFQNKENLFFS